MLRVIPEQVNGRLGSRSCAKPLHAPDYPGRPGIRNDLRGGGPTSWVASCFPSQAGNFVFRSLSPQLAWLAGLRAESSKRNPGTWSDFLRNVALLKAELRLKQRQHKKQIAKWGSFGGSVGERGSFPSHVRDLRPVISPPQAPVPSPVQLGATQ